MYTTFTLDHVSKGSGYPHSTVGRRACDSCRKLKIKCRQTPRETGRASSDAEPCEECRSSKSRCTYLEKPRKPGRRPKRFAHVHTAYNDPFALPDSSLFPIDSEFGSIPLQEGLQQDVDEQTPAVTFAHAHASDGLTHRMPSTSAKANANVVDDELDVHPFDLDTGQGPGESEQLSSDGQRRASSPIDAYERYDNVGPEFNDWDPAVDPTPETLSPCLDELNNVHVRDDVQQFFEKSWIVFPVLSYDSLSRRMSAQREHVFDPALHALLLSIRMANLSCEYRIGAGTITKLLTAVREVEKARLEYEFTEPPALDEVVVSLFLFVAHNVLEKHTRAYLYLDEAFSLLEVVEVSDNSELQRKKLLEQVLFNTETATIAVYARPGRHLRARIPTEILDSMPTSATLDGKITEHEKLALHLLTRLTRIHAAGDAAMLGDDYSSSKDLRALLSASLQQRQYCRIQAADVSVSHQWQLSTKLVTKLKNRTLPSSIATAKAENLGVAAMAWICSLKEGELRIVGLGKIFGMLQAIRTIAGNSGCESVVNGLVGALMREDHEQNFAPGVARMILPLTRVSSPVLGGRCIEYPTNDDPTAHKAFRFEFDNHTPTNSEYAHDADMETIPSLDHSEVLAVGSNGDNDNSDIRVSGVDWFADLLDEDYTR